MKKALDKFTSILSKLCPLTLSQSEVCKMKINMDGIILTSGIQTSMGGIILTSGIQTSSTLEQSPCGNGSGINLILKSLFYSTDEHPRHCLPTDPVSPVAKETSSYHRNPDPYMIQEKSLVYNKLNALYLPYCKYLACIVKELKHRIIGVRHRGPDRIEAWEPYILFARWFTLWWCSISPSRS